MNTTVLAGGADVGPVLVLSPHTQLRFDLPEALLRGVASLPLSLVVGGQVSNDFTVAVAPPVVLAGESACSVCCAPLRVACWRLCVAALRCCVGSGLGVGDHALKRVMGLAANCMGTLVVRVVVCVQWTCTTPSACHPR
jgi:hypothetical protein